MVLSDIDIRRYLETGKIRISPALPAEQFGSCSVDFRLGSEFSVFEHSRHPYIDVRERSAIQDIMRRIDVKPGEPFVLQPREFALAITEETLELDDDVLGRLEGRSSLGRIGIIVHGTAGLFDPGWRGKATLELSNLGIMPVALYPGHAYLLVHLRATIVAGIGTLLQESGQQVRRPDAATSKPAHV